MLELNILLILKDNIMSELKIFKNTLDDSEYLEWKEKNQDGYILNVKKAKAQPKDYPKMHSVREANRKKCIKGGNYTTESSDYYKVCSNSILELEVYSWQECNIHLTGCGHCMRGYTPTFQIASLESLENDLDELNQSLKNGTTKETQIQRLINARKGQGTFRNSVLKLYPQCPVSGVDMPELLIASHIKPWCDCNNDNERLDQYNGLMLAPNIDALFDSGLITFESDGKIRISKRLSEENLFRLGISLDAVLEIHPDSEKYFEWHRNKVFKP